MLCGDGLHEFRLRQKDPDSVVVCLLLHSLDGARRRRPGIGVVVDSRKDFAEGPAAKLVAQIYLQGDVAVIHYTKATKRNYCGGNNGPQLTLSL